MEKGDHAFSTPTLRIRKERERERERERGGGGGERERERETTFLRVSKNPKSREHKGQRITVSYRP